MKKNIIVLVISLSLIATTTILASSASTIPSTYEKTKGIINALHSETPTTDPDHQTKTPSPEGDAPERGGGFGLIGDTIVSSFEWGSTKGRQTQSLRLGTSEYYLIASNGDIDNDLYLTTIHVENDDGTITNSIVDSWEIGPDAFMQSPGTYLCQVTGDIYAITYQHNTSNNIVKTFTVSSTTGLIQKTPIDTLTLSNRTCSQSILKLTPTIFVIASQKLWNNSNTGYLETIYIDSAGNIGDTVNDTQQFSDFIDGLVNPAIKLCSVDSDTLAIIFTGLGSDGYLMTFNISSNGAIQNSNSSWWEFDGTQAITPDIIHIAADYYALAYSDSSADGQIRVFRITNLGSITRSWIDSLEFDIADCWYPQISYCGNTSWNNYWYAITYRGTSGDGFITMVEITKTGCYISDLVIDRLEFDLFDCQWTPSLLFVNETYYLIVYPGADSGTDGSDGWATTIHIYTNRQPPKITNPFPANQAISIDPNPLLQVNVADGDSGGIAVDWYGNSTGSWLSFGSNYTGIDTTVDIYEFDITNGQSPQVKRLGTSNYYLVAYAGSGADGYLSTFKVFNTNGTIKKQLVDTWEYDITDGIDPSIVQITEDLYAVAYRDITDDRAKVFTVRVWDDNGTIQKSMVDTLTLTYDGTRLHLIRISGDYYAVTYTEAGTNGIGASYDGFIETIQISTNGLISDTILSIAEYDIADAYYPRLMMIDSDTILICYQGTSNDGFIRTYNISSSGIFNNITADLWEFDTLDGLYPDIVQIGANRYAFVYRSSGRMYARTVSIADNGLITKTFIDSMIFDYYGSGTYIRTSKVVETTNQYLIVYASYPNTQLIACTVNISQDGIMDDQPVDKTRILDLGANLPNFVNIAPMGNGYYLLVYEGLGNDGYLQTIGINPACSALVQQHNSNFALCGTTYWWRVDASDGINSVSRIFSFTTQYAPNANNDIFTVNEDSTTQLSVLANDNDPEGHPLTIISVDDSQHGTTSTTGTTVTYTPDLNYNGPDSFGYTISDGHGGTDTATVSITVNPVNDPPSANDDSATVVEDSINQQINVLLNDVDIDGDTLTVTGVSSPAHGTATFTTTYVRYTPAANYNGPDSFTYTISDGHGGTDTAMISVTVTPVNDPPVANDDTAIVTEDSVNNQINVLTNDYDIDPDPISISAVTQPIHGAVTYTISSIFYTPVANYNGPDTFTYTIIDGYGGSDTATVTITVTPVNDPPDAVDDTRTVTEDSINNQVNVLTNDVDIDGDTLTVTGVSSPAHGTATFTTTYVRYTPAANYNGPDSFTYTISDGHGGTDTATVSVTVTPVNDPPVANDDTATVLEDSQNNYINVLANDNDIDGNPITIISITQPLHGSSTFTATSVYYTPTANYSAGDSFSYTISDGQGSTDIGTITVTITPVNDQPVAFDDTANVPEDSNNYQINARANDIDVDGDLLTIVSVTSPAHGIASTNGVYIYYDPALNYYGSDGLSYTISDGNGGSDTANIIITVTAINDPPFAINDTTTVAEDSTNNLVNVLANDYDVENDPLTIASVTQPSHGTASINSGFIFYSPTPNYNGQDMFTYQINDGHAGVCTATVIITVVPMNDPPNAYNDTATVAEDSSNNLINVLANDNDPDGDTLSIASVTNPPHGSVTTNGAFVFYTPAPNYFGIDTFPYTLSDGHGGTDIAIVTVTVAPLSDPPVANDDAMTVQKDSVNNNLNVLLNDYDPDSNPLTIISVTPPLHGSTSTNGAYVFYTPTAGYTGSDTCSYTINDGTGYTDTATISLTVSVLVNDPPNAVNDVATVTEDSSNNQINVLLNDNDPNGDTITINSITQPTHGVATFTTTYVRYTPTLNYYGTDSFTYTITDGASTDSATINVTISSVNDAPVALNDTVTVSEDSSNNQLNVLANDIDVDGDTLSITTVTTPAHGTISSTAVYIYYTPALNYAGIDTFVYTVIDGHGGTDTAVVTVNVTAVNDPPNAVDDIVSVSEDSSNNQLNVRANDFDVDGDSFNIISVTQPLYGSTTFTSSFVYYTPIANYYGSDSFTYTILDSQGNSDSATVQVTVLSVNDPPVAENDTTTVVEDSTNNQINVRANDFDNDGDSISITAVTQPVHGSVIFTTQYIYLTPTLNYFGSDTFTYTISDGNGGTDTATVFVSIIGVNDPPNAIDDTSTVVEDSSGNLINVLVNDIDIDGDTITIISISQPPHGSATFSPTQITYNPSLNYNGPDSITYSISDGHGGTDTAIVSIFVTSVNDPPVATDDMVSVQEDSSNNQLNVRANDNDADGDPLSIISVTQPAHGSTSTDGSSAYYTPASNYVGPDSFIYTITDGHGSTDTATVFVTVINVNDPPVANDDNITVVEDSLNTIINVLSNDFDFDYNTLTIIGITQPPHGISSTNGVFIFYTPLPDYFGSDLFSYTISDGIATDTATVMVTVTPMNDPPVVTNILNQTILEGNTFTTITLDNYVSDPDNTDSEIIWTYSGNIQLTINIVNRVAQITTPDPQWAGSEVILFRATDPGGLWDDDAATFTVTNINDAPVVSDIPDQTILEGGSFTAITLDEYVSDFDNADSEMTWAYSGNTQLSVSIMNRIAIIATPNQEWSGSETITFRATDPGGLWDDDPATFTVTAVNDPPVVTDIPDQIIAEGAAFSTIALDTYVSDVDNSDAQMIWTYSGNSQLTVNIVNRVATITIPNADWYGSEIVLFTATDPGGLWDDDSVTLTVTNVNDVPVVGGIPDQTILEGGSFATISLDNYVSDVDNSDAEMTWTYSGNQQLTVNIVNRVATISAINPEWSGTETIVFKATDPGGLWDDDPATFTITPINDAPLFGLPSPANGSMGNPLSFSWSIPIYDPEGNLFNWNIHCSNGQTNSGTGASNGTKTLSISGLGYLTSYTVWVNATDPSGSGLYTRRWYTFTTKQNLPPVFGTPVPGNGSTNNPLNFVWSIPINDPEGNLLNWSIHCSNGQYSSGSGASNGTKTLSLTGLGYLTSFTVWVNATDPQGSGLFNRQWYMFTTKPNQSPVFGTPNPANGSTNNPLNFTWSIPINDPEGNLFNWNIHCSNGETNSGTGASNGTKTISLTGLQLVTWYTVWVNATDPAGSGLYTRRWYTFSTGVNLPPVFGASIPANASITNHLSFSWRILIIDPDGDLYSWSIQCSNGQYSSGTGSSNGTRTLSLSGLAPLSSYMVWVNATDPLGSGMFTRHWYTFNTGINLPPVFGTPTPANGSTNVNLTLTWGIPIADPDGDLMSWSIQCSNGQSTSGSSASNGTKTLFITGLESLMTYTVWVNATDPPGINTYTRRWYTFSTELNLPPEFGTPTPSNGSMNMNLSLTWSIPITDPEGDLLSWFIQCSNGQSASGTGATNGTKEITLSGLAYSTNYTVWVNASDPLGSGKYLQKWYLFTTIEFINSPPEKPERPSGSSSGRVNVEYTYTSSALDIDGNQIWLWFNWGDGSDSGWVGPYASDSLGSANHMWTTEGSFNITVKAKDTSDAESVWSDPLLVSMPVEVDFQAQTIPNVDSHTNEETNNQTIQTPTQPDYYSNTESTKQSTHDHPSQNLEHKNIYDMIRLIIRMVRGEFPGMNLLQILRTDGWI